jgi:phosphate transport system substrate-binding protein
MDMISSFRLARRSCALSLAIALLSLGLLSPAKAAGIVLKETGSTLLYPLFQMWISDYPGVAPGVTLTAAATGSGEGLRQAIAGQVQIGASDAYMSDERAEQNPEIKNIPLAISAQTVNYNITGLNGAGLKLDGPTLAGIYAGRITEWDADSIKAMNPSVNLPHQTIVPIRREDASGDTFIFTQFLDFSTQSWQDKIGYGTTVDWPAVAGERTATSNDEMVKTLAATPYSVAYVGISFRDAIAKAGLGTAMLKNQNSKFVPDYA